MKIPHRFSLTAAFPLLMMIPAWGKPAPGNLTGTGLPGEWEPIKDAKVQCAGDAAGVFPSPTARVLASAEQADGRILVGTDDTPVPRLRRFWPTGAEDTSFAAPEGVPANAINVLRNGDVIISKLDSNSRGDWSQVRLSGQGRWKSGTDDPALMGKIAGELPDRSLVLSDGTNVRRISRDWTVLHSYPSVNSPVNDTPFPNGFHSAAAVTPNGKVLSAWWPDRAGAQWTLVRMSADGVLDPSFVPAVAGWIDNIVPLADGSVLLNGSMTVPSNPGRPISLVKLRADGSEDPGFHLDTRMVPTSVSRISVDDRRRIVFVEAPISNVAIIRRLLPDGSLDEEFASRLDQPGDDTPWLTTETGPWTQKNGRIFVAGSIDLVNSIDLPPNSEMGSYSMMMVSLHGESRRCPGFLAPPGESPLVVAENGAPLWITLRRVRGSYGSLTVPYRMFSEVATLGVTASTGADFPALSRSVTFANGELEKTITIPFTNDAAAEPTEDAFLAFPKVRSFDPSTWPITTAAEGAGEFFAPRFPGYPIKVLDDDSAGLPGSQDFSYAPQFALTPDGQEWVLDGALQSGGRLVVAGTIGYVRPLLVRLNADGSRDNGFRPDLAGLSGPMRHVCVQPDGSIIAASDSGHIAGWDANGARKWSFGDPGTGVIAPAAQSVVNGLMPMPDGRFLANIRSNAAYGHTILARYSADGRRDFMFRGGALPAIVQETVPLTLQTDGKVVVAVQLLTGPFNGPRVWSAFVMRLDQNGAEDPSFPRVPMTSGLWNARCGLPDGGFLINDGALRRYRADGSLDTGFSSTLAVGYRLRAVLDAAGRLTLITSGRPGIARLLPDGRNDPSFFYGTGLPDSTWTSLLLLPGGDCLILPALEYNSIPSSQVVRIIGDP